LSIRSVIDFGSTVLAYQGDLISFFQGVER